MPATKTAVKIHPWIPAHPALTPIAWDNDRTDVHGVACITHGWDAQGQPAVTYTCACGFETAECATDFDATCELISHALNTCAACRGEKPADNFPRCSRCAF